MKNKTEIIRKLQEHRMADLKTGLHADKYYGLDEFRGDIKRLSLKELETLRCEAPLTYDQNNDHLMILDSYIQVLSCRKSRITANISILVAILSLLVAIISLMMSRKNKEIISNKTVHWTANRSR